MKIIAKTLFSCWALAQSFWDKARKDGAKAQQRAQQRAQQLLIT
ncbi:MULTISPECIES: hypothetical protein [Planktothrix]|nr:MULTISPECIES: hypothetical protein [Planktothrix]